MPPLSSKISGIPVTSIVSMKGANVTSIVSIGGISTSSIPGWPSACITRTFGYADLFSDPNSACEYYIGQPKNYFYNGTLNVLYGERQPCGGTYAPDGYYSDGVDIYLWNQTLMEDPSLTIVGTCG